MLEMMYKYVGQDRDFRSWHFSNLTACAGDVGSLEKSRLPGYGHQSAKEPIANLIDDDLSQGKPMQEAAA